ncbi:hypothetical protein FT663_00620 [Candidozyma haemuli var. vulneris]|uniref:Uncharacterized protein n=1 Tax=Candidozyma haemuli TaxID=45357 RepID=A0A2V1AMQ5_9ASCO|nr:hypothetical protein CXQ85_003403 [[Candida] haemuloni]KAF3989002.1 hypothetical protein FT662_03063 [[Candida] haemuloni var. vulneris]KAF3995242.1 hypothetical protein FT663_00620 [[Candida] haemuloni var. vulneris]PVH19557.1 hypothetical protein CXQ85_003403 [[Candida] haemuloni]
MNELTGPIKIDDIASGKIDSKAIYDELERLKAEVNILRNDMSLFLKQLATIPEKHSQQEYQDALQQRLTQVQNTIKEYCVRYNRLLPIINLSQIKLGQEPETNPKANGSPAKKQGVSPQKNGQKKK